MTWQSKLDRLLTKFLEGDAPSEIKEHLEKFVSYFQKQEIQEIDSGLITHPIFIKWAKESVTAWSTTSITPSTNIASFTLNLVSFLSKSETNFCSLNTFNNFYIKLVKVLKVRQPPVVPSTTLAYINLLSSFLEHKSGIEWMTACNFWEDIYHLALTENEEIVEASTGFMSKILANTITHDETFCNNVVQRIMAPLGENIYKALKAANNIEFCNEIASKHLKPSLKLIGNILYYFMDRIYHHKNDFGVPFIFLKNFHLEQRISDFMIISHSQCLLFDLAKIMFTMQFLEFYVKTVTKSITGDEIEGVVRQIRQNFFSSVSKKPFEDIVDFCNFGILYWNLFESKIPVVNSDLAFPKQLIILLTVPNYFILFSSRCLGRNSEETELSSDDQIRQIFAKKILKSATNDLFRVCYGFRDSLTANPDTFKICCRALTYIKNSQKYFTPDQAVQIFQTYIYTIKDIVNGVKQSPQVLQIFLEEPQYMALVFQIIRLSIERSQVKWKDSCETIEIIPLCFDFLSFPELPTEIVVEILKLINVAIENYLAPNLALLVDDTTGSSISLLGPLLYSKLLDDGVKLNALEVIHTIASFSSRKFPSLHTVLVDSELPQLVAKLAVGDEDSLVRTTALKCLQEMIQVEKIWRNVLKSEELLEKMCNILRNEPEGSVRAEAATFMRVAYEHQRIFKEDLDRIYETMIYSSLTDLHGKVKICVLNFWDKVIINHLQNQGMIDDSFPTITFSKEHRKIVTLTDSEIRKRLLKVLGQLSSIGCLWVLMVSIMGDCDVEVSKIAVEITQRLIDLFKKYDVRSDCNTPNSPSLTENEMSASSGISVDGSMDSPASSSNYQEFNEEVINSRNVSLLKSAYTPSDDGSVQVKVVTPNEFLQFCQQDLNSFITEKKNWLSGIEDLGLLLDDILKIYDDGVSSMEC